MHKTLLAIGAHYDDCVFGVPGVLLQAVRKQYRVVILSLIGDYSRWAPVGRGRSKQLVEGTTAISTEYGVEMRYLDYASMGFGLDPDTKRRVSEAVAEIEPDLALMLWPNDTHPDHEAASAISKTALRWAGTVLGKSAKRPSRIYQFATRAASSPTSTSTSPLNGKRPTTGSAASWRWSATNPTTLPALAPHRAPSKPWRATAARPAQSNTPKPSRASNPTPATSSEPSNSAAYHPSVAPNETEPRPEGRGPQPANPL
jgi:LmbE family N-acetylglucosaminyl deacetylase